MKLLTKLLPAALLMLCILNVETGNAQMYWNTAARVSGDGYVAIKPASPMQNLSGSYTFECWFNAPENPTSNATATIFGNNGLRILLDYIANDRVRVRIQRSGVTVMMSRYTGVGADYWLHFACTYDSTVQQYKTYYNGNLDSTATNPNGPVPALDSIFIGKSNFGNAPILVDDIRVFGSPFSQTSIKSGMRTSYDYIAGLSGGHILNCSFEGAVTGPFNSLYFYDGYNQFSNRGATPVNLGKSPSHTLSLNNALKVGAFNSYARMPSDPDIELTGAMTIEMWINPDTLNQKLAYLLAKKTAFNGVGYAVYYDSGRVRLRTNVSGLYNSSIIPQNKWTHIAFSLAQTGEAKAYVNGILETTGSVSLPGANSDSLFIGGFPNFNRYYKGYIDALKISNYEKTGEEIREGMFRVLDYTNDPEPPRSTVCLNFDFYTTYGLYPGVNGGQYNMTRGAVITRPYVNNYIPVSPILGSVLVENFPNGYDMKSAGGKRIPEANTAGYMQTDSVYVGSNLSIQDINLFVALNHSQRSNLRIHLISPAGDSVMVWNGAGGGATSDHLITVFDEQAESDYSSIAVDYGPRTKTISGALNSAFSGQSSQGWWRLSITDLTNGDIGYLYGWGIQINNRSTVGIENISSEVPDSYKLEQNYPNPFNPSTSIKFKVQSSNLVSLKVFDITGREIAVLVYEKLQAGSYEYKFDGRGLPSGVYFYRLEAGEFTQTKKMLLIK